MIVRVQFNDINEEIIINVWTFAKHFFFDWKVFFSTFLSRMSREKKKKGEDRKTEKVDGIEENETCKNKILTKTCRNVSTATKSGSQIQ